MKHIFIIYLYLLFCSIVATKAQECNISFQWTPVKSTNKIEWEKFPSFSLPFTIIYEGPRFGDTKSLPLSRGFTHLATFSGNESTTLPFEKRAITWYHIATVADNQPWAERNLESPWANDINLYKKNWNNQLQNLANFFDDSRTDGVPRYDLMALDIERIHDTDREILSIKNNTRVPETYQKLSDNQFIDRYKKDIQKLYTMPIVQLKEQNSFSSTTKIGSYSDVMIRGSFNNWLSMTLNAWKDWTTDPTLVLHLMRDTLSGNVGGSFYKNLGFLTPSCYYYYNYYTSPFGKDYLAYILFVVEANRSWSDKPIIPFIWLRYHDAFNPTIPFIPTFVAEATAIFPFFSGAKGLWLWDAPVGNSEANYAIYEHFIASLYRLSQFKSFFEGNYTLVIPQPAVESAKSKTAIWRGVVKNNEILIAAQNPYVDSDTTTTKVSLSYNNWQKTITLKGREVLLCKYNLDDITTAIASELVDFKVTPNPAINHSINCEFQLPQDIEQVQVQLLALSGQIISNKSFFGKKGYYKQSLNTQYIPNGMYIVRLLIGNKNISKKVVVAN